MSSKAIEDAHQKILDKILLTSGLECVRPVPESLEALSEEGAFEEHDTTEAPEEARTDEEAIHEQIEEITEQSEEELPDLFPTPSLRRVLPEHIRNIEAHNRIHVLPEEFITDIDPEVIPQITLTASRKYIDILAGIVGCTMYKSSLAEYWFLDTLANLLRRAQEDNLNKPTQAVLILWFCEWMKEMQNFDAADRQRMLQRFQENMLSAAEFVATEQYLPTPTQAGVMYKAKEVKDDKSQVMDVKSKSYNQMESKQTVSFQGTEYDCSLRDLTTIIHYIFDLFSTDYQYDLVRSIFTFPPEYVLIDAPYQIQNPKRLYVPVKVKPKKEKSPKKDAKGAKGKKKEPEPEEYVALLEHIAREERQLEEQEQREMEELNRRSHILPLNLALEETFLDRYWPPPPPEPEPEPEPEAKTKGKGKK